MTLTQDLPWQQCHIERQWGATVNLKRFASVNLDKKLTLGFSGGAQRVDLEGAEGLSFKGRNFHTLLRGHSDIRLRLRNGGQELVHICFLILQKFILIGRYRKEENG